MTLKEFRAWFEGFCDGVGSKHGLSKDQFDTLIDRIGSIKEITDVVNPYTTIPKTGWEPCKTVPLNSTPTFDPSVVYNNGAVATSSTGKSENV